MKILHLLSNRKWTNCSEIVANLVGAQLALGLDASLVCGRAKHLNDDALECQLRKAGIEPLVLWMTKHFRLRSFFSDVSALRAILREGDYDIIHVHLLNAHLIAAFSAMFLGAGFSRTGLPIVVNSYDPLGYGLCLRSYLLGCFSCRAMSVISQEAKKLSAKRLRLAPSRVEVIEPGIDLERFDPHRGISSDFDPGGIDDSHFVVGVVSRIRGDRRLSLLIEAVALIADALPRLRLLLIGRGEGEPELRALVSELSLCDRVIFGGYCRGDDLVCAYRRMHVLAYPVCGSDRTCRTVREAMASGLSVICPSEGYLTELLEEDSTALFVESSAHSYALAFHSLAKDRDRAKAMGGNALREAKRRFSLELQAKRTLSLYERVSVDGL